MAIIKKFRIKSYKKIETVIEFQNVTLSYGNRLILDNINFKINKIQFMECWDQMGLVKAQFLT